MTWAVLIVHAFWLAIGLMLWNAATTCASPNCEGAGGSGNVAIVAIWAFVEMFLLPLSFFVVVMAAARRLEK